MRSPLILLLLFALAAGVAVQIAQCLMKNEPPMGG